MTLDLHTFNTVAVAPKRLVLFWLPAFVFPLISRLFLDVHERMKDALPVHKRRGMVRSSVAPDCVRQRADLRPRS